MQKKISCTNVFSRIRSADTRIIVNEGSSRSTKTFSILQYLIMRCLERDVRVSVCRAKLSWAKMTVIPDFKEVMKDHFCIWDENDWNKSENTYYFKNGSELMFVGIDEPQKLHGKKQDYAWVNEAVEIEQPEFTQLLLRTKHQIILDYNPAFEQHWIYDKVIPRNDCTLIHSTYLDNPFLSPEIVNEIERLKPTPENILQGTADEVSWKIYGLGERAAHKGLIYGKATLCKELPPIEDRKKHFFGLDFGFTNDPTALTEVVLAHGNLYFKQRIYKRGLTNIVNRMNPSQPSIQGMFIELGIPRNVTIWADSAEPKSIADLRGCGWNVRPAVKGPDSVVVGIETILRHNIFITEDSIDGIKEKNNYKWKEVNGSATNQPIDSWNHFWDAGRYGCIMEIRRGTSYAPISGHAGVVY
jgi:phage terminase large subunit